ncbi:MAG: methylmalonyl-CoA mutase family protein [Bacteroidales bacterium]|jgi:methylmalonyl-CoA mutase|nr:methylmalonyl-CoA mutase family protein [Bacteroidales bacterium]
MNEEKLFNEFSPVSTETWKEIVIKDLKGADYDKKLVWKTEEGFNVEPFYRVEDLANLDYLNVSPDEFPFVRTTHSKDNSWDIVVKIHETDPTTANAIAHDAIKKGATIITFNATKISTLADVEKLLTNLSLETIGVRFIGATNYVVLFKLFIEYVEKQKIDKTKVSIVLDFDPIIDFAKKEKFFHSQEKDLEQLATLLELSKSFSKAKVVNVSGFSLNNAGATIVQELSYALSTGHEYLNFAINQGFKVDEVAPKMSFTLSVGANYFMEIAKLRAARLLWATIVEQYHPENKNVAKPYLCSVASVWNKTIYDPYVNMLRSTTEGMSAAIGGADAIYLQPFDVAFKEDDEFSRRINRNTQLLLKEEAHFDKVIDPAAGSYYIENLTASIAQQVWQLFLEVEKEGGIIPVISSKKLKEEIAKSCKKRDLELATRRKILLGTNQYPNVNELMFDKIEQRVGEEFSGLPSYKGAAAFENLRLATEQFSAKNYHPKVFLLKVGNASLRQARAEFTINFFGCAGYGIVDNTGFDTVNEGVNAAKEANSNIVVICSSDDEYATLGVEALQLIKKNNPKQLCVIAGNPVDAIEALNAAGADGFIHVKTNVLYTLKEYNKQIGIS